MVCHWQSDGLLYFYCKFCHVSISEKDLWNGIHKELHQRLEEHKNLKKLIQKNSGKSVLETKKVALNRKIEQLSGSIVRLESQKRSSYEQYVLGKISKEKFLELKQNSENEIAKQKQEKSTKEKEFSQFQVRHVQHPPAANRTRPWQLQGWQVIITYQNIFHSCPGIVDRKSVV